MNLGRFYFSSWAYFDDNNKSRNAAFSHFIAHNTYFNFNKIRYYSQLIDLVVLVLLPGTREQKNNIVRNTKKNGITKMALLKPL